MADLFIISAPSGAGKTSLIDNLVKKLDNIFVSVSMTTRKSRQIEKEAQNYYFVDECSFKKYIKEDYFLEYAKVFDNYYGTPKQNIFDKLANKIDVILEIDWQGARQIQKNYKEAISIFILPPSLNTLNERLIKRKQNSKNSIKQRLNQAYDDMTHYNEFDYVIINDNFTTALEQLRSIITSYRLKVKNSKIVLKKNNL